MLFRSTVVPLVPHAEEGSLNILAVTTRRRTMALPNVPSIAERTALKDFDVANWLALLAPSGTPRVVIERLAAATDGALKDPEVIGKFRASDWTRQARGRSLSRTRFERARRNGARWSGKPD